MDVVVFNEKSKEPSEGELANALGSTHRLWNELRHLIALQFKPLTEEWVFSGKNYGWLLRLKQKKRAILYLKPCERHFRVSFAFGEKAVQAAQESDLPVSVLGLVRNAPKYPEGRAVRIEVRDEKDVRVAVKLALIKMAK